MKTTWTRWAMAATAAAVTGAAAGGPARADDWADPAADSLASSVRRLESARSRGGEEMSLAAVVARHDEVTVFADLARVDVTLDVANRAGGNEWRRLLVVEPEADLVAATYVRPDGLETSARTMSREDSRRIYGRATDPGYGRDPLVIEREARTRLDVSVFPVRGGQVARVLLSFVTPLHGRGEERTYRDPLAVRAVGGPEEFSPTPRRQGPGAVPVATANHAADLADAPAVAFRLHDALPGVLPEGRAFRRLEDGALVVSAPRDADPIDVPLRTLRTATPAVAIRAGAYGGTAFALRVDAEAQMRALGVEPVRGRTLRLRSGSGSTGRIAPEVLGATDEPTVVMGRSFGTGTVRLGVEVLESDGKVMAKGEISAPCGRASPGDAMEDAMRAYHRARLVERVFRWAGEDAKRLREAVAYAVDLGVVGRGVGAIAVPRDERDFLTKQDVRQYLTDGAPIGADDDDAKRESKSASAPAGSVR